MSVRACVQLCVALATCVVTTSRQFNRTTDSNLPALCCVLFVLGGGDQICLDIIQGSGAERSRNVHTHTAATQQPKVLAERTRLFACGARARVRVRVVRNSIWAKWAKATGAVAFAGKKIKSMHARSTNGRRAAGAAGAQTRIQYIRNLMGD